MKIRNGFVSNSSTSSFVVVMTKVAYDTALEKMGKKEQALIKLWAKKGKLGKENVICFSDMTDTGGTSTMFSPERNSGLDKFSDYVAEKWDGDFSAVFYDGFLDNVSAQDKIEIREEI